MTLITLPSGTVLANDYTLPIIVVSKVLMANDNNPHAKLYPYYFTINYIREELQNESQHQQYYCRMF